MKPARMKSEENTANTVGMVIKPEIWRHIFDAMEDPAFLHDKQFRVMLANRAYCHEAGVTEAEALGKPYWEVFPLGAGPLPGCKDAMDRESDGGSREEVEVGSKRFLSKSYTARDEQGKSLYALHILSDITERERAEELLKNMAAKFHTLYESSPDAIMLLNEKGFFDCNEATLKMFGCHTRDEFVGKQPAQFSPPTQPGGEDSMSLANERIATAFKNGSILFEWTHRRTDGADFPAEVLLTALKLAGKPTLQATVRDITERKQAEERNLRLGRMYRTISRGNKALVQASDELELAHAMCRLLVEEGHFLAVWVGYAEQGTDKHIRPVAAAGIEMKLLESLSPTWADKKYGQGPAGTAIRTGQVAVCHDISSDVLCRHEREMALQQGYSTVAAIPVQLDQHSSAILVVYGAQANELSEDIVSLLTELAGDLAFGIGNLRSRTERISILEKLEDSLDHAVTAIAATVEMRDPYTAGHQRRVAILATAIATEMGLPDDQVKGLHIACVVHDIGKIHVPAEILSSPAKLTDAEFAILKTHPEAGWEILKGIDFPWPVAEMVYQHHERLDGSGYPRGLKGDEILLEARIIAVADVVEAMTSHRPYRPGLGIFTALQEISQNKGKLFDVAVVEACLRVFIEQNFDWSATANMKQEIKY